MPRLWARPAGLSSLRVLRYPQQVTRATAPPQRTSICLACRTALYDGERCDHPRHSPPVSLLDSEGRRRLADRVWGSASLRARAKQAARSGGAGGGAGAVFESCEACGSCGDLGASGELGTVIAVILIAAVAAVVLYFLVKLIIRVVNHYRHRLVANPADRAPAPLGRSHVTGTVEADQLIQPPLAFTDCVAYGVELSTRRWWEKQVMLRDGATSGFRVRLDDGRVAVVPPGRAVVDMRGAKAADDYLHLTASYLSEMTGGQPTVDGLELVPCERAELRLIRPGERVALFGALVERPDPDAPQLGGYRDAPPMRLELDGVAKLRVVA